MNLIPGGTSDGAGPVYALAIFAVAYLVRPVISLAAVLALEESAGQPLPGCGATLQKA